MTDNSLSLLTDLYQLTMAYGYWKNGTSETMAVFHLYFRNHPFKGGYPIASGMQTAIEFISSYSFTDEDLSYLASLAGNDGKALFESGFLSYLKELRLTVDVDAVEEGNVVFANEPLLRVSGPMLQCQLLESALLNIVNFQTLIATKANRVARAAGEDLVLEFGLRRAQGVDGALAASRAAYIGGCHATSNVLAGKMYGIPVRGTHAHSWVMSFEDELQAFHSYASAMPNNCIFLVDTYDTLEGVRNAVRVGVKLKESGYRMTGIRLDSGDLAYLSIEARRMLDEAGLHDSVIVASNDLDERLIVSLKQQGAKINVWGVGTKLVTAYDQPALGGVYKLAALNEQGEWKPKIKLSEQTLKTSTPGKLQVWRFYERDEARADMIINELQPPQLSKLKMIDPEDPLTMKRRFPKQFRPLLVPVINRGSPVSKAESVDEIRDRVKEQQAMFHHGIMRFDNPHRYPVGLEEGLFNLKRRLILQAKHPEEWTE